MTPDVLRVFGKLVVDRSDQGRGARAPAGNSAGDGLQYTGTKSGSVSPRRAVATLARHITVRSQGLARRFTRRSIGAPARC